MSQGGAPPPWVAALVARIDNSLACARNASALRVEDSLLPLSNGDGVLPSAAAPPVPFPATVNALRMLSNAGLDRLLVFYGLNNPFAVNAQGVHLMAKRRLVARHIGVPGF